MKTFLVIVAGLIAVLAGCQQSPDFESLRQEILELHRAGIQAHLDKDVGFFTRNISDDYFSVGRGEIRTPAIEEIRENFSDYLNSTTFTKYEDLQDPVIGFSDDGSIAWSIVQVRVEGIRETETGEPEEIGFTCAWITLFRRQGDGWIRLGESSSFKA